MITGASICNSPLNHSLTKQMYSFGKAERFPKISQYGTFSFYNLPDVKTMRGTSFGYGNKSDFTLRDTKLDQPAFYPFNHEVESRYPYAPKYSFGLGRDNMKKTTDQCVPGPGKYYIVKKFGSDGLKYSIKGKYKDNKNNCSPGPAYAPITKINPDGKFYLSKNENVHPTEFSKDKTKRFNYYFKKIPGPADYKKCTLLGKIFESKYKSHNGITVGHTTRFVGSRNENPGPGAYETFSEFGIFKKLKKNNSVGCLAGTTNNYNFVHLDDSKEDIADNFKQEKKENGNKGDEENKDNKKNSQNEQNNVVNEEEKKENQNINIE